MEIVGEFLVALLQGMPIIFAVVFSVLGIYTLYVLINALKLYLKIILMILILENRIILR